MIFAAAPSLRNALAARSLRRAFAALAAAMVLAAGTGAGTAAAPPPGHAALPAEEWRAIQDVITAQIKALKAGDGAEAISYAVPGLRRQYRSPERFLRMVRDGYGALLTARASTFLAGAVVDGATLQPLQLVLPDNSVVVAIFRMERQRDGAWRIAGCVIAPSTVQAT